MDHASCQDSGKIGPQAYTFAEAVQASRPVSKVLTLDRSSRLAVGASKVDEVCY